MVTPDPFDLYEPILTNAGCVIEPDEDGCITLEGPALGLTMCVCGAAFNAWLDNAVVLKERLADVTDPGQVTQMLRAINLSKEGYDFCAIFGDGLTIDTPVLLDANGRNHLRRACHLMLTAMEQEPTRIAEHLLAAIGPWYEEVDNFEDAGMLSDTASEGGRE